MDLPLRVASAVVMVLFGEFLAYNVVDKLGALAREAKGRLSTDGEMLRAIVVAVAKVVVVIGAALVLAEILAIPYEGVIVGLGIGGLLAVALAAKSTLENLIGGLTLVADKPVRVGDFCRFGDKAGAIEELGLRSVKDPLRGPDGVLDPERRVREPPARELRLARPHPAQDHPAAAL